MSSSEFSFDVREDLGLGSYPAELARLARLIARDAPDRSSSALEISWSSSWLDLTLLAYVGQVLRLSEGRFAQVNLHLQDAMVEKIHFLWDCGFWHYIRANYEGSRLYCTPDPWKHRREPARGRANYTRLFGLEITPDGNATVESRPLDRMVGDCVNDWDSDLRAMACFPVVAKTDLMHSREYLFLLLWELVHNACVHSIGAQSSGHNVALAGQVFLSPEDIARIGRSHDLATEEYQADSPRPETGLLRALGLQYSQEVRQTRLDVRRTWLKQHKDCSFMLLTCTDCGVGIPASLKAYRVVEEHETHARALARAFSPWTSSRRNSAKLYDVHGLSQILRVVEEYDGYLFVQSGEACMEFTSSASLEDVRSLPSAGILEGTLFQILLPFRVQPNERPVRTWLMAGRFRGSSPEPADPERRSVVVVGELRRAGIEVPVREEDWTRAADVICKCADQVTADPLYLDLVRMPADRQFLSLLLRIVRRTRLSHGVVVINAPGEFLAVARRMQRLDLGDIGDADVEACAELDRDLAVALSRNEIGCLPLLLPLVVLTEDGRPTEVAWLGLGSFPQPTRRVLESALNLLLASEKAEYAWSELYDRASADQAADEPLKERFPSIFDAIVRCNRWLLEPVAGGCRSLLTWRNLEYGCLASLRNEVSALVPQMEHRKQPDQNDFLYSLAWHRREHRFRKRYYRTWRWLADSNVRHICASLLVQEVYHALGHLVGTARAVVSATPSAGLLGQEVAAILGMAFYEVPSIYEIDRRQWLPPLDGPVIVVDDVLDTGRLTSELLQHVESVGATTICVLTLLENAEGVVGRPDFRCPVVAGATVQLGVPPPDEVARAVKDQRYFEVDPHSLEPVRPERLPDSFPTETSRRLDVLARDMAIFTGHIVHGEHHYDIYFSLADALASHAAREEILGWVTDEIRRFAQEAQKKKARVVTVVYPYYSPIRKLVSRLRAHWDKSREGGVELRCVVAEPCQLTGTRIGYQLAHLGESTDHDLQYAVFLDDGIASGGTLAAILDELVSRNARELLALVLFDRIGLQPRRHLRRVQSYQTPDGRTMRFSFHTFISTNVRSHYEGDCPECLLASGMLERCRRHPGFLGTGVSALEKLLARTIVSSERVPVPSRLGPEDILSVASFRHVALSDTPSPQQIEKNLARRAGACRLECIATILSDPKLFRQITNVDTFQRWIIEDLSDPRVDSDLRARFLLRVAACTDKAFASQFLAEGVPKAYVQLASKPETEARRSLSRYFDKHQREFLAVAAALYSVSLRVSRDKEAAKDLLREWKRALASDPERYAETSLYAFHLGTLFEDESALPLKEAEHLVANFAGSYWHHGDSFAVRLSRCRLAVNSGRTETARDQMPPEMLIGLVHMIERTQDHFEVWPFGKPDFDELLGAATLWQNVGDGSGLARAISCHFLSESIHPATVDRLLSHLAPRVGYVLGKTLEDYRIRKLQPVDVRCTFEHPASKDSRVLGTSFYLWRIVSHLLDNAHEAWNKQQSSAKTVASPPLAITIDVRPAPPHKLAIEVCDNVPCEEREIEEFFAPGGALATHQSQIGKWGGTLKGEKLPHGWKRMVMELRTVQVERPLRDPDHEAPRPTAL